MAGVDFSPMFAPAPPSEMGQHLSRVGSIIDAIVARREAKRKFEIEQANEMKRAAMVDARVREQNEAQAEINRQNAESLALQRSAQVAAAEEKAKRERAEARQKALEEYRKQALAPGLPGPEAERAARPALTAGGFRIEPTPVPPPAEPLPTMPAPVTGEEDGAAWVGESPEAAAVKQKYEEEAKRVAAYKGREDLIDDEGNRTMFIPAPTRATLAAQVRSRFSHLAPNDPRIQAAISNLEANVALGDKAGFKDTIDAELDRISALERSKINAEASRNNKQVLSAGEAARIGEARVTGFRADVNAWEGANKVDKIKDLLNNHQTLISNIEAAKKENTVAGRAALFDVAKAINGTGVLTDTDYARVAGNLGGFVKGALAKVERGMTGGLEENEIKALEAYVKNAATVARQKAVSALKNYDFKYGPKNHYRQTVADEVASHREALLNRLGLSEADLKTKTPQDPNSEKAKAERKAMMERARKMKAGGQ